MVVLLRAKDIEAKLRAYADRVRDGDLKFAFSRLAGEIELIRIFQSAGRYTEAKYAASVVRERLVELDQLSKSGASPSNLINDIEFLMDEIDRLPDTVSVADRSGEILARKGAAPGPERFPIGTRVRIASLDVLARFKASWAFHHPLLEEQLMYAGSLAHVRSVGYYHGEDVLYTLDDTSEFVWHEQCLEPAEQSKS